MGLLYLKNCNYLKHAFVMKYLSITISNEEIEKFGIKNGQLSFSELLEIIKKEIIKKADNELQEPLEKYLVSNHRKPDMDTEKRKRRIIAKIGQVKDELLLRQIEANLNRTIENLNAGDTVIKPLRASISVDEMVAEQNYTGIDRADFDKLINELDIQEPLIDLLKTV
jgi:hypothetical protein